MGLLVVLHYRADDLAMILAVSPGCGGGLGEGDGNWWACRRFDGLSRMTVAPLFPDIMTLYVTMEMKKRDASVNAVP